MTIVEKEKCCACRACVQVCPKKAVSTIYDEYGFERISVDEQKCVNCGLCKTVCPIVNPRKVHGRSICGSAYSKDKDVRLNGSSGGLFGVFARAVIDEGGVVYGAAFDSQLHLLTTRAQDLDQLKQLYKSKYLLCDTCDSFKQIENDLKKGIRVLYCSSPCQLAALNNYLQKSYENLICVEFVCHGVGGQKQFDDSIYYIENKKNIKIKKFSFREKFEKASSHYYYYYYYEDLRTGKSRGICDIYMTFPYYFAYEERLTCRESCYKCIYATEDRAGDITIGDFHTINKYEPSIDRFAGVSMFVCNTERGRVFFDLVKNKLEIKEYDWQTIKSNNRFSGKEELSQRRECYLDLIAAGKYSDSVKEFLSYKKDWRFYYYHAPKWIRNLGNKVLRKNK